MYAVSVLRLLDCSHLSRELRIPKGHGSSISFRVDLSLGRVRRNGHWIPRDEPLWYERFRNQSRNWHSGDGCHHLSNSLQVVLVVKNTQDAREGILFGEETRVWTGIKSTLVRLTS